MPENAPIYRKYNVSRTDGADAIGGRHEDCATFVLDLTHDPAARPAMEAFAQACKADRPKLAESIWDLLDSIPPVPMMPMGPPPTQSTGRELNPRPSGLEP